MEDDLGTEALRGWVLAREQGVPVVGALLETESSIAGR